MHNELFSHLCNQLVQKCNKITSLHMVAFNCKKNHLKRIKTLNFLKRKHVSFFQTAESLKSWWGITLPLFSVSSPYFVGGVSRNHNFGTQLFHFSSRKTMQHVKVEWHPSSLFFLKSTFHKKNAVAKKKILKGLTLIHKN